MKKLKRLKDEYLKKAEKDKWEKFFRKSWIFPKVWKMENKKIQAVMSLKTEHLQKKVNQYLFIL